MQLLRIRSKEFENDDSNLTIRYTIRKTKNFQVAVLQNSGCTQNILKSATVLITGFIGELTPFGHRTQGLPSEDRRHGDFADNRNTVLIIGIRHPFDGSKAG